MKTWDKILPLLVLKHNNRFNETLGTTPAIAHFGKPLPSETRAILKKHPTASEYVDELQERIRIAHEAVRAKTKAETEKRASKVNKGKKGNLYKIGDMVMHKVGKRSKLEARFDRRTVGSTLSV